MEDLSLHLIDIIENSIKANAKNIEIKIWIDKKNDIIKVTIKDDGKGMTEDELKIAFDPFYTSVKNKKTGLGLSLLRDSALKADGNVDIFSEVNKGTEIQAYFKMSHPDMIPLGDLSKTILVLVAANQDKHFKLNHICNGLEFNFDTEEFQGYKKDIVSYLKKLKDKLENYKNFLEIIKGDLYGI